MLAKMIIIFVMILIVTALASGLIFLVRDKGDTQRPIKALSWRIGLSVGLFIFLLIAYHFGWIAPHGIS